MRVLASARTPVRAAAVVTAAVALVAPTAISSQAAPTRSTTAVAAAAASGAAAVPTATKCSTRWGSTRESSSRMTSATVRNVRAGRHACFDRLVIDLGKRTPTTGYWVEYVTTLRGTADEPIPLRGGAKLSVAVNAPAYDDQGRPTYTPKNRKELVNVSKFTTFRQVRFVESFEGVTLIGLGVRARLPFRVFVLKNATRQMLVVDVAHRW